MNREMLSHFLGMPFTLIAAHALADFPLQGSFLSIFKDPTHKRNTDLSVSWQICMSAHCMIHACFVYLLTGSLILGCFEFVAHFTIDYWRCRGRLTFNEDQGWHVVCKLVWCMLLLTWKGIV